MSLPSRKCGLKSVLYSVVLPTRASLPSRKCGLKCSQINKRDVTVRVTSFAEVWIEILMWVIVPLPPRVTSFAEVWIEIQVLSPPFPLPVSLPSRKCGLKLLIYDYSTGSTGSLPSRKCGLKFYDVVSASNLEIVTSFAEVWIEILQGVTRPYQGCVTSFAEVWIEISFRPLLRCTPYVTSFAEVWIEMYN